MRIFDKIEARARAEAENEEKAERERFEKWMDASPEQLMELSIREIMSGDDCRNEYPDIKELEISKFTKSIALSSLAILKFGIENPGKIK